MEKQGREPASREAEQKAPDPDTSKRRKEIPEERGGSLPHSTLIPSTYIGEVQAQLEFFAQPLAPVIVGSCGGEDGMKQTSPEANPLSGGTYRVVPTPLTDGSGIRTINLSPGLGNNA